MNTVTNRPGYVGQSAKRVDKPRSLYRISRGGQHRPSIKSSALNSLQTPRKQAPASLHTRDLSPFPLIRTQFLLSPPLPTTNLSPALLPLNSTPQADLLVPHKLPYHPHPALMVWQILIEFLRHLVQRGETRPWNGGEVVVFVVQADVVSEEV